MQNDFITGPLGTPEAVSIVDNVVEKINEAEKSLIVCTFDTHNDKYKYTQEYGKLPVRHCIYGEDGWHLHSKVSRAVWGKNSVYMTKPTFGCLDLVKAVDAWTRQYGDIELTLVGVCTDICVISNALLLKAHYPEMTIVVDASCCAGSTPEKHRMALGVMKSCQIDVINNTVASEYMKSLHSEPYNTNVGKIEATYSKESED